MKIVELYKRGKPILATFYLIASVCCMGVAIMCLLDFFIGGVILGLLFAYLNFSWLPAVSIESNEKAKIANNSQGKTNDVAEDIYKEKNVKNTSSFSDNHKKSNNLNRVKAEEVSYNYVKLTYKKFKYIVAQNAPKTLETFPERDLNGEFPSRLVRKDMLEAFIDFKPTVREEDGRHIIKLENFLSYGLDKPSKNENYKIVDKKYKPKLPIEYGYGDEDEMRPHYLKVKAISKYIMEEKDGYKKYYVEIGDIENNFVFEDKISVFHDVYEKAEIGNELILVKDNNDYYSLYNVDFFD